MTTLAVGVATVGALFVLLGAVGLFRLPDPATRLHAVTKGSTLGVILVLSGTVIALPGVDVAVKAVAALVFQLFTAPISAHVIGRAAYRAGLVEVVLDEQAEAGSIPMQDN